MRDLTLKLLAWAILAPIWAALASLPIGGTVYYFGEIILEYDVDVPFVIRASFIIVWWSLIIGGIGWFLRSEVAPAWRLKTRFHTDLGFAFEHRHESDEQIRFRLRRPPGFEPWDEDAFQRWEQERPLLEDSGIIPHRRDVLPFVKRDSPPR